MGSIFDMGPEMMGPFRTSLPLRRAHDYEGARNYTAYCDPKVDPSCQKRIEGAGHSFQAESRDRETPPSYNCNPAWDPGCPRQAPTQTMAPYVPSSYTRGNRSDSLQAPPPVPQVAPAPSAAPAMGARGTSREQNPSYHCNPAWDPGCPRQAPTQTLVPYVPSSYLRGPAVVFHAQELKFRPRDRSGRRF